MAVFQNGFLSVFEDLDQASYKDGVCQFQKGNMSVSFGPAPFPISEVPVNLDFTGPRKKWAPKPRVEVKLHSQMVRIVEMMLSHELSGEAAKNAVIEELVLEFREDVDRFQLKKGSE